MQHFFRLPETGKLDKATINLMAKPRCGVPDVIPGDQETRRKRRYALHGSRWGNIVSFAVLFPTKCTSQETL